MKMPEDWISVKEAAKIKDCTTANINYYIKQGKVEAVKEKGRWQINPESLNLEKEFKKDFDAFEVLKVQLEEKDKQIALLQEELSQSRDQSNQIIAALTQQNQLMLEDKTTPWYRRLFGKNRKTED